MNKQRSERPDRRTKGSFKRHYLSGQELVKRLASNKLLRDERDRTSVSYRTSSYSKVAVAAAAATIFTLGAPAGSEAMTVQPLDSQVPVKEFASEALNTPTVDIQNIAEAPEVLGPAFRESRYQATISIVSDIHPAMEDAISIPSYEAMEHCPLDQLQVLHDMSGRVLKRRVGLSTAEPSLDDEDDDLLVPPVATSGKTIPYAGYIGKMPLNISDLLDD